MRAVDTNVPARFYLRDDAAQARVASSILSAGNVFVSVLASCRERDMH